jgi:hypothetical protein
MCTFVLVKETASIANSGALYGTAPQGVSMCTFVLVVKAAASVTNLGVLSGKITR